MVGGLVFLGSMALLGKVCSARRAARRAEQARQYAALLARMERTEHARLLALCALLRAERLPEAG